MRNEIQITATPIKGKPEELARVTAEAIAQGSDVYDCTGGFIVFSKLESELDYLKRLEEDYKSALTSINKRIIEILESEVNG